jgi:hypothetical protein
VSDADTPGRTRPGRRPKDQKRIPVGFRITPTMNIRLVTTAKKHGRSFSAQTECLLERALNDQHRTEALDELYTRLEFEAQHGDLGQLTETLALVLDLHQACIAERLAEIRPLFDFNRLIAFLEKLPPEFRSALVGESRPSPASRRRKSRRSSTDLAVDQHDGDREADGQSRRAMYAESGKSGEVARVLPVEISVTRGDDGSVRLVRRHGETIIAETPLDIGAAQRLADELVSAASGNGEKQIEPKPKRKSRRSA